MVNCAAWTDVDGAETHREQAHAVNADGAGNLARAAAAAGVPLVHVSTDYVFAGDAPLDAAGAPRPYVESDPTGPRSVYGETKLEGELQVLAASPRHAVVRSSWLFGVDGQTSSPRCWPAGRQPEGGADGPDRATPSVQVVTDQIGCPTWTGHLAPALLGLLEREVSGLVHLAGAGEVSWNGFAREIFRQAEVACRVEPASSEQMARPRPAPRVVGARVRARGRPADARLARRSRGVSGGAGWDDARMKLLVCGGAGFIGSTFVRQRLLEHGDEVTVLDKLTYAGREENFHDFAEHPSFRFLRGAIEDPAAVAGAIEAAAGGDRQLRRRDARRPLDRRARRVRLHPRARHLCPARGGARARGLRYLQVSTDEVYGSIDVGTFTEESPLRPSSPYSATKAGADLLVQSYFHTYELPAVICRGSNNYGPYQYPEKLIP